MGDTGAMTTTALRLQPAWPDPEAVLGVIRAAGPFWPLTNYAAGDADHWVKRLGQEVQELPDLCQHGPKCF